MQHLLPAWRVWLFPIARWRAGSTALIFVLMIPVICPSCFEEFEVSPPALSELPAEWDYDCEVCCRPMIISFHDDGDEEILAEARGLGD